MRLADMLVGGMKVLNPKGGCASCPLRARTHFVQPEFKEGSKVLVVAPKTTRADAQKGQLLSGSAGKILRSALNTEGVPFSVTSLAHCARDDSKAPT